MQLLVLISGFVCHFFFTFFPEIITLVLFTTNSILILHSKFDYSRRKRRKEEEESKRKKRKRRWRGRKRRKPKVSRNSLKLSHLKCAIKKCYNPKCSRYYEYISSPKCINLRDSYCLIISSHHQSRFITLFQEPTTN